MPTQLSQARHVLMMTAVITSFWVSNATSSVADTTTRHRSRLRGDRGEVSSTTIMIAVLVLLSVAVGTIITTKITAKANSISP